MNRSTPRDGYLNSLVEPRQVGGLKAYLRYAGSYFVGDRLSMPLTAQFQVLVR